MSEPRSKAGALAFTLATYVYLLADAGISASDDAVRAACDALRAGGQGESAADIDALGAALVDAVEAGIGDADLPGALACWYGADHIATDLGDGRDERLQHARKYQFNHSLPWLAEIVDRFPDGAVRPHWVLVERVTDAVSCMDPYPWDDLDEEVQIPVIEFLVKWELAGVRSARWVPAS